MLHSFMQHFTPLWTLFIQRWSDEYHSQITEKKKAKWIKRIRLTEEKWAVISASSTAADSKIATLTAFRMDTWLLSPWWSFISNSGSTLCFLGKAPQEIWFGLHSLYRVNAGVPTSLRQRSSTNRKDKKGLEYVLETVKRCVSHFAKRKTVWAGSSSACLSVMVTSRVLQNSPISRNTLTKWTV